jgi:hypothetical protein
LRAGARDIPDNGSVRPVRQRAAADFHHGVPELYGLVVRRR